MTFSIPRKLIKPPIDNWVELTSITNHNLNMIKTDIQYFNGCVILSINDKLYSIYIDEDNDMDIEDDIVKIKKTDSLINIEVNEDNLFKSELAYKKQQLSRRRK
jgi:hypothetical protein